MNAGTWLLLAAFAGTLGYAWLHMRRVRRELEARGTLAMETLAWSLAIRERRDFELWSQEMRQADR